MLNKAGNPDNMNAFLGLIASGLTDEPVGIMGLIPTAAAEESE